MSASSTGLPGGTDTRMSPDGMRRGDRPILPLWLRIGVLGAVLAALVTVLVAEPMSSEEMLAERGDVLVQRALFFQDGADGVIRVLDASAASLESAELLSLQVGDDGFIRSVMRGLVRERKSRGIGPAEPFLLGAYGDGRLYVDDPATDRQVVVTAFGPDNVKAFLRLLPDE